MRTAYSTDDVQEFEMRLIGTYRLSTSSTVMNMMLPYRVALVTYINDIL
jgi:hypothetical protein